MRRPVAGLVVALGVCAIALGVQNWLRASTDGARGSQPTVLTVFAAASLSDAFKEISAQYEARSGVSVMLSFGASSQLRTQLKQGAQADVFASADQPQMERARAAGLIDGQDVTFAMNRLVIITPVDNPAAILEPRDLARPGVRLVTASAEVPIGVYTQTMFGLLSQDPALGGAFLEEANANVVSREPNVRQLVAKIQLGEGDAAVVYSSDVTPQVAPALSVLDVPERYNVIASYPIARLQGSALNEHARGFIDAVLSSEGQSVLRRWGFIPAQEFGSIPGHFVAREPLH